jgi:hypothetical protein
MKYPDYIKPPRQYFGSGSSVATSEKKKSKDREQDESKGYDLLTHAVIMSTMNY